MSHQLVGKKSRFEVPPLNWKQAPDTNKESEIDLQGPIVVNVCAPDAPTWNLQLFVDALKARGYVLSNFSNTEQPTFRVGCIGAFGADQMRLAVDAMGGALRDIGITRASAGASPRLPHPLIA